MRNRRQLDNENSIALAIDIGRSTIRGLALKTDGFNISIVSAMSVPAPEAAIVNGIVVNKRPTADTIRELTRRMNINCSKATLSVPTDHVTLKWIDVPNIDQQSLRATTPFELTRHFPHGADKVEAEIVPVRGELTDRGNRVKALLVAAPREVARSLAETLEMAGLEVEGLDAEPLAVLRCAHRHYKRHGRFWGGQSLAHVHIGSESSGIITIQGDEIKFVRGIAWGASRLKLALAESRSISSFEAEVIIKDPSAELDEVGNLLWHDGKKLCDSDALAMDLDRLRREVLRILNYYRSLFPERSFEGSITRLVLSGGVCGLRGLDTYLSNALQLESVVCHPFQSHGLVTDIEGETGYTQVFGQALGGLARRTGDNAASFTNQVRWRRKAA